MPEELEPKTLPEMRPLDDAGDVGHHEGARTGEPDDAEVGLERSERIVAILGRAAETTESSVLLPALGSPTRPTSAMSLSSSSSSRSCPSPPGSHSRGA
jgi:hypothetical protein